MTIFNNPIIFYGSLILISGSLCCCLEYYGGFDPETVLKIGIISGIIVGIIKALIIG